MDNPDASILTTDTVRFDTVFTSQGSATRIFKIFNINRQKLRLDNVRLSGGTSSAYQLNINGTAGVDFSNIDIDAGDSIYCFVRVNIDPNSERSTFVVSDSIQISYNGKMQHVQLQAYGQNAIYLHNAIVNSDTVWKKDLPIVLLNNVTVPEGKKLTIEKASKIYCHKGAGLIVNGTLIANGDTAQSDRINFTSDRLDYVNNVDYKNLAGAWPGISFGANSVSNMINNVNIKNAEHGIIDTLNTSVPSSKKIVVNGAIIQNNAGYGILSRLGNIEVVNSLIANNGSGLGMYNGGNYAVIYCTLAGYSNLYVSHNNPVLMINGSSNQNMNIAISNSILYGDNTAIDNEIGLGADLSTNIHISLDHSLAKYSHTIANVQLSNMLQNVDPSFVLIDNNRPQYDFRINNNSPCRESAIPVSNIVYDLPGNKRNTLKPAIGCYENP